jgi:hypothetical protein
MTAKYDWIIGVDCGLSGAAVLMDSEFNFTCMFKMPTVPKPGAVKSEIDLPRLVNDFKDMAIGADPGYSNIIAIVENPGIIPTNGAVRLISILGSYYMVKGALAGIGIQSIDVPAQKWKKQYDLPGGRHLKKKAVELALQFNPELESVSKEEADVFEAALVARYGAVYMLGCGGLT